MRLGPETKFGNRNKTTSRTFDDDVMSENCEAGFLTHISVKLIFSLIVNFYFTKNENRTKKSLTQL